jgi:hypothetical protein
MPPEDSAQPEHVAPAERDPLDQPLDAVVYDVHPALAPKRAYPYGPPLDLDRLHGENPFRVLPPPNSAAAALFNFSWRSPEPAKYKVPPRFGMSAILGIMTALAILFGGLRFLNAPPVVYLFFGMQALVICVVQMFHNQSPRFASSVAGGFILPVFVFFAAAFSRYAPPLAGILCMVVLCIPVGAFLGYLTGTCAAGIFLVMDALEPYLQGRRTIPSAASPAASGGV